MTFVKKTPKLTNCCCSNAVYTLWTLQLPLSVRSHVASLDFNATTYKAVFQSADKVFLSTKDTQMAPTVAAIISTDQESGEAQQVAAVGPRKGNRGGFRGGRGNRGGSEGFRVSVTSYFHHFVAPCVKRGFKIAFSQIKKILKLLLLQLLKLV